MNIKRLIDKQDILDFINRPRPHLVIDTETTGLNPRKDSIVDIQLGTDEVVVFDAAHKQLLLNIDTQTLLVGHGIKFDLHMLYRSGVDLTDRPFHDTMLMHHLVNENAPHDLDSIIKERWNDPYKDQFWSTYKSYLEAPDSARLEYGGKDVAYTHLLYVALQQELKDEGIPVELVHHVHELQKTLLSTEIHGLAIDTEYLIRKGVDLKQRISTLIPLMRSMVDEECNIIELERWGKELAKRKTDKGRAAVKRPEFSFDSSKQLLNLLYDKLALPAQINEKTKNPSVDDDALQELKEHHPLIPVLHEYRGVNKVYGTYIEGTLERSVEGRVYPSFNVNGTVTGRISHSNPNLGQLPREGGIRSIYVPNPGDVFIGADYSSLEVVIEANLTHDKNLCRILKGGLSKHDITAQELGVDRHTAKTLNFASQYHCTPWKISKLLNISQKEAEKVHARYWEIYSGPRELKQLTDKEIDRQGFVVNMLGRKRRFGLEKRPPWSDDYRQGYNFKIQGPGADFTHKASYLVDKELRHRGIGKFVLSIHDEILISANKADAEEAERVLVDTMEGISDIYKLQYRLSAVSSGPMPSWQD